MINEPWFQKIDIDHGFIPLAKGWSMALRATVLSGYDRGIIDTIMLKTYGVFDSNSSKNEPIKKKNLVVAISIDEFKSGLQCGRTSVFRSLKKLEKLGIIIVNRKKINNALNEVNQYSLNPFPSKWDASVWRSGETDGSTDSGTTSTGTGTTGGGTGSGTVSSAGSGTTGGTASGIGGGTGSGTLIKKRRIKKELKKEEEEVLGKDVRIAAIPSFGLPNKQARKPTQQIRTWDDNDPLKNVFNNLSIAIIYGEIFDVEFDRKLCMNLLKQYSLSVNELEQICFDLVMYFNDVDPRKIKSPRGMLNSFCKKHVQWRKEKRLKEPPPSNDPLQIVWDQQAKEKAEREKHAEQQ